jgi:hypothetical protein
VILALQQGFFLIFYEEILTMKIKTILITIFVTFFPIIPLIAAEDGDDKSKCKCDDCHQLDFWIGEWKVEWENPDGTASKGTNSINTILNGCVIQENFDGNPGVDFKGKSFSVYNHAKQIWQQTWVDTEGNYMVFTGSKEDEKMILTRKIMYEGNEITQRMIFYNIEENSFDWNWEASKDNGKTWKLNWKLRYTRL